MAANTNESALYTKLNCPFDNVCAAWFSIM